MTILLLANHSNTGGITTYLMTLTRAFIARGHRVVLASSGGNMVPEIEKLGAIHVCFGFDLKCEVHPRVFFQSFRLADLIRDHKVDIIHAQTRVTQMSAALASRLSGIPYVSTCHGFFKPHLGRRILPLWGQRVIAVSAPVKEHLIRDFKLPVKAVALIANGIDLGSFTPLLPEARTTLRRQWGVPDSPVVGIVARLSDVKGHQFLIEAMPRVLDVIPTAKCFIFGNGPLEAALKAMVKTRGLDAAVLFYPVVNRTAEVLPLLDVFVMPSLQEGLGLAVLEAAAMSIPAVASRVGGLIDAVQDKYTGLLVGPGDPAALAKAIIVLLSDKKRARSMGENARDFVVRNFSAETMAEATLSAYQSVISERR